jgi:hypothetical protein
MSGIYEPEFYDCVIPKSFSGTGAKSWNPALLRKAAGVIKHTTVRPPTRSLDPAGIEELWQIGRETQA